MDLPTADQPLRFVLRLAVPALKNNRQIIIDKAEDRVKSIANSTVRKAVGNIRAALVRQLPPEYSGMPVIPEPHEVRVWVSLGVFYKSALPQSDLDNAYTTVQEALQGVIIEDDRQVCGLYPDRQRFVSRQSLHTVVVVWVPDLTLPYSALELLKIQEIEAARRNYETMRFAPRALPNLPETDLW